MIKIDSARVKDFLNKTKLPHLDYVINPYVGCPGKCLYCYACYMAGFSKHLEPWGEYLDIKKTYKKINIFKIKHKKVVVSTVTDPYNIYEEQYGNTRMIMEQLAKSEAYISVVTKSKLVLRDIDLFKQMKYVKVALSFSTLDENVSKKLEPCSTPVSERIETLKILKENGIKTVAFVAPVIPQITDYKQIIEATKDYVDEYWFDKLSLRTSFKTNMFDFIDENFPVYKSLYVDIYNKKNSQYFEELFEEISQYCSEQGVIFKDFSAGEIAS